MKDKEEFLRSYKSGEGFGERVCDDNRVTQLFPKNKQQRQLWTMLAEDVFGTRIDGWTFEVELEKKNQSKRQDILGRDILRYGAFELPDVESISPDRLVALVVWFRWHAINDTISVAPLMYSYRREDQDFARKYMSELWDSQAHKLPAPPKYTG